MIHLPVRQTSINVFVIADALGIAVAECVTPAQAAHIATIANAAWCLAMAEGGSVLRWRACYAELLAAVRAATEEQ